ncbi:MAG: Membrane-associated zinc metalloprotease [Brockia lithotrophica]|uniref:Zinc metalloprotease n=1 Tax=Brockia lithotrophica TaxID=933949 RepID=A0A2T5G8W2_9BACL|nr:MAG: Membrane-associated zinc metalloprotease [Brockia lithotrophica]
MPEPFSGIYVALAIAGVFTLLVFVHEFGHYTFAKRAGILIREFAIGFGPRLVSWKRGETTWSIRLFPLGGYVRMAGEEAEEGEIPGGTRVYLVEGPDGRIARIVLPEALERGKEETWTRGAREAEVRASRLVDHLELEVADPSGGVEVLRARPDLEIVTAEGPVQFAPRDRLFGSKTIGHRFAVLAAGPVSNILLALLLFFVYFLVRGVPSDAPVVGGVLPDSPAQEAGITPGERIVAVGDVPVRTWDELGPAVSLYAGKPVEVALEKDGVRRTVTLTPEVKFFVDRATAGKELKPGERILAIDGRRFASLAELEAYLQAHRGERIVVTVERQEGQELRPVDVPYDLAAGDLGVTVRGQLGVQQAILHSPFLALVRAPEELWRWAAMIFGALGHLFVAENPLAEIGGPVLIMSTTGEMAKRGLEALLFWTALLSLNLGIFNLIPIPALDGARILFLGVEWVRGRPLDPAKENLIHLIGFAFLLLFILVVTWKDVQMLLGG